MKITMSEKKYILDENGSRLDTVEEKIRALKSIAKETFQREIQREKKTDKKSTECH